MLLLLTNAAFPRTFNWTPNWLLNVSRMTDSHSMDFSCSGLLKACQQCFKKTVLIQVALPKGINFTVSTFNSRVLAPKGSKVSQAWKQELLWLCDGVQLHRRDILQQYSKSSKRKIVRYLLFFVNAENVTLNSSKASLLLWPTYTQTWGNDGEPHRAQIGNGVSTVVHTLKALLFCPPVMVLTIFDAGDGPNWPWLFLWQVSFYQA